MLLWGQGKPAKMAHGPKNRRSCGAHTVEHDATLSKLRRLLGVALGIAVVPSVSSSPQSFPSLSPSLSLSLFSVYAPTIVERD